MLLSIPRLTLNRHGIYYYRLHNSVVDVRISLRTKHPKEAVERLRALETCLTMPSDDPLNREIREALGIDVEKIRKEVSRFPELRHFYNGLGLDPSILPRFELGTATPKAIVIGDLPSQTKPSENASTFTFGGKSAPSYSGRTLSKLIEDFSAYTTGKIAKKTEDDRKKVWGAFIAKYGDLQTTQITRSVTQQFKQGMGQLSFSRQKTCISHMRVLLAYAKEAGEIEANPFGELSITANSDTEEPTETLTPEDLRLIFSNSIFNESERLNCKKAGYFWAPILLATTGARPNEIAQLRLKDIKQEGDITYIDINDEGDGQTVKTSSSKRKVPIHNDVIRLGFMDFVSLMRTYHSGEGAEGQLFVCMTNGKNGWSKNLSRNFNEKRLPKIYPEGLPRGKRLRSLRKTFITTVTGLGAPNPIVRSVVGHSDELGVADTHVRNYNNSHSLTAMKTQVIERFPTDFLSALQASVMSRSS